MEDRQDDKKEEKGQDKKPHHEKDYEPRHDVDVLKRKIEFLEEEIVRKEQAIERLKKDNDLLFKTAVKNSVKKVEEK